MTSENQIEMIQQHSFKSRNDKRASETPLRFRTKLRSTNLLRKKELIAMKWRDVHEQEKSELAKTFLRIP